MPECQETVLVVGVVGIGVRDRQRIAENRRRLGEGDAVLGEVGCGFLGIPLEPPGISVTRSDRSDKGGTRPGFRARNRIAQRPGPPSKSPDSIRCRRAGPGPLERTIRPSSG
jgi:hypothetical protein